MACFLLALLLASSVYSLHENVEKKTGNHLHRIRREVSSEIDANGTTTPYSVIGEFRKTVAEGRGMRPEDVFVPKQLWELEFGPNYTTPSTMRKVRKKRDASRTNESASIKVKSSEMDGPSYATGNVGTQINDTSGKTPVNITITNHSIHIKDIGKTEVHTSKSNNTHFKDIEKTEVHTIKSNNTHFKDIENPEVHTVKSNNTHFKDIGKTEVHTSKSNNTHFKDIENPEVHTIKSNNTHIKVIGKTEVHTVKSTNPNFKDIEKELYITRWEDFLTDADREEMRREAETTTLPSNDTEIRDIDDLKMNATEIKYTSIEELKNMFITIGGTTTRKAKKAGMNFTRVNRTKVKSNRSRIVGTRLNYTAINILKNRQKRKFYWARQTGKKKKTKEQQRWEVYQQRNLSALKEKQRKLVVEYEQKQMKRKAEARERRLLRRRNLSLLEDQTKRPTRKARKMLRKKMRKKNQRRT